MSVGEMQVDANAERCSMVCTTVCTREQGKKKSVVESDLPV